MLTLVRQARRRLFSNELLRQGANAASAALAVFILLLLFGTDLLSWQWLAIVPACAAAVGIYLARKKLPGPYLTAQIIDDRLRLADTLSTAMFFRDQAQSGVTEEVRQLQLQQAEELARNVDVRKATPYMLPRAAYLMAALVLVASSLFALRYGITRRLDLKPPLASILQETFGIENRTEMARNSQKPQQPDPVTEPDDSGAAAQDPDDKAGDHPDSDASNATQESADPKANQGDAKNSGNDAKKQAEEGDPADGEQKDGQGDGKSGDNQNAGGQQGDSKSDSKKDSNGKQDPNGSGENSSLMSKVKDAVQNLLSRMKPQQGQTSQNQSAADQKNSQSKGQQNSGKQQAGKDGQPQNGGQQGDAQEGEAGQQADSSQDPQQGKSEGKSNNQQASKQPGSGIGSQDGDKSIKQAEQLAAMGKISEILGKRSATITGEATVEVQNTSQQLHTPYAQRANQHTQGGTEINRDEIPVALQSYVEQYFEQVRKTKK